MAPVAGVLLLESHKVHGPSVTPPLKVPRAHSSHPVLRVNPALHLQSPSVLAPKTVVNESEGQGTHKVGDVDESR